MNEMKNNLMTIIAIGQKLYTHRRTHITSISFFLFFFTFFIQYVLVMFFPSWNSSHILLITSPPQTTNKQKTKIKIKPQQDKNTQTKQQKIM